jgi:VWFA-related protein
MRQIIKFILVIPLLIASMPQVDSAQTRPRRTVEAAPNTQPSTAPSPQTPKGGSTTDDSLPSTHKQSPDKQLDVVGEEEVLRINTTLVTVPVSITDRDGRYIPDLQRQDFHVFENGSEQEIAYFATADKPVTVVLMLDTSASTWSKLGQIRDAAMTFVDQLRPDDRVMVVSFARGFTVQCDPTSDRKKIRKAIRDTGRGLSTHLYDAMNKLMKKILDGIQGRKAVVLFTDGVDASSNNSTYESTLRQAEELDGLIYPIRYDTYDPAADTGPPVPQSSSRLPSILRKLPIPLPIPNIGGGGSSTSGSGSSREEYDLGERYLHRLAELTGGRVYEANKDLSFLADAFAHIAAELRRQYSIGYYPQMKGRAGERRQIKVTVNRSDAAVRARGSYIYQDKGETTKSPSPAGGNDKRPSTPPVLQQKPFADQL